MRARSSEPDHEAAACPDPEVDLSGAIPPRLVTDLLDDAARAFGDRPCLDFLGRRYRYEEVAALAARAAKGLRALGVGAGTRVGLFLPNTPYFVVLFHAVLKAGGVVVNFNPLLAEREIEQQIEDSGVEIIATLDLQVLYGKLARVLERRPALRKVIVGRMRDILPIAAAQLFVVLRRRHLAAIPTDDRHVPFAKLVANDGAFVPTPIDPASTVAVLQYTGGTTGTPKGAELTHANLYVNAVQTRRWYHDRVPGQERILAILPLVHIFGLTTVLNVGFLIAAELVLLPRFEIRQLMRTIQKKRPTVFPAVPTLFTAIARYEHRHRYDLSSIDMCSSGGAPLPLEVKDTFERLTGCVIVEGYGLTEAAPVVCCNPLRGRHKAGSIGLPIPLTETVIVSLDDGRTPVPDGERGELCVRGPQVMQGYSGQPEETARTLMDGLLHTGDIAYRDADGYLFIVDRIKDVILCGGFNVYPRHVEEAIYLHPAVEECVVAGVPDDYRGQTIKAWIKLAAGQTLTVEGLRAFLEDKLSHVEMPRIVDFREAPLPKTPIGKLSRKDLLAEEQAHG